MSIALNKFLLTLSVGTISYGTGISIESLQAWLVTHI